jgi:sensor domain CHASE-containing protein
VTTTAVAMMMTMTMLAQAIVLDVARLLTQAIHKEVQGVHQGMKHRL